MRSTSAAVAGAARESKSLVITTVVPLAFDVMSHRSISRRAPTMPRPMPVIDR